MEHSAKEIEDNDFNILKIKPKTLNISVPIIKKEDLNNTVLDIGEKNMKRLMKSVCENSFISVSDNTANINANNSVLNCLVCFEKVPDSVFMNCGHGGVCFECGEEIFKNTKQCYLCRQDVQELLQIDPHWKQGNLVKIVATAKIKE